MRTAALSSSAALPTPPLKQTTRNKRHVFETSAIVPSLLEKAAAGLFLLSGFRCLTCSRIAIAGGVLIHEKFQESLQIDPRGLPCSGAGAEVDTGVDLRIPHRHGRKTRQQAADSPGPGVHGVLF